MKTIDQKLREIMKATGWKQQKLAEELKTAQGTVSRWLSKKQDPEGSARDAINELYESVVDAGPSERNGTTVPIMGFVGAGGEIDEEYEQTPADGLDEVWIPFELDDDLIAFEVRGISMMPAYREGHIIICHREQKRPVDYFFGIEAVVKTDSGRRYLKTIMRNGSNIDLYSFNAAPIPNVKLEWIGEIFAAMPRSAVKRIERRGGMQARLL
ncbi:LexA family transcriptional regulator [Agrobacterium tumefaciens]|uniref:LexA family transcriptional regulator n=1 Tax=Agrobacterium tumefaciens TaxID=358 RepID=UPI001659DA4D|nr:XRE family transcriptional regulator [Agrobacterium tumefaciens]QNP81009.1 helix-turn-helix transcriptional regulator [Agrobacterium tumefaciens]